MIGDNWPDAPDEYYQISGKTHTIKVKRLHVHPEKHYVRRIDQEGWMEICVEYMMGGYCAPDGSPLTVKDEIFSGHPTRENERLFNKNLFRAIKNYYGLCKEIFEAEEHALNVMYDWKLVGQE